MFARAGQLALPGAEAQLGLDGVAYAPLDSDRSPERASSSLGTHTGFCNSAEAPENLPPNAHHAPAQLALDLDAWEEAPQLSLWGRQAVQRDVLAYSEWDRQAKCGWVRFKTETDVPIDRRESGSWSARNVVRCGYPGCPWCGTQLAQQRAAELGACMEKHLDNSDGETDCWMLSLTIPHYASDSASVVVEHVYAAQAALVRTREWRAFVKQWGLLGNGVRCLDTVSGGANGLHAHFHIALFPTRAGLATADAWHYDQDERKLETEWVVARDAPERWFAGTIADEVRVLPAGLAEKLRTVGVWSKLKHCSERVREKFLAEIQTPLVEAWERCCEAVGIRIENRDAFRRTALRLTPSEKAASYFVKWGLSDEVARSTAKDRSPLRLLDAIAAGIKGAAYTYKQFRRAVDGRQWVTGIADLRKRLDVSDEEVEAHAAEQRRKREAQLEKDGTPVEKKRELSLVVRSHLFSVVGRVGWLAIFEMLDAHELTLDVPPWEVSRSMQKQLDDFLWRNLAVADDSRCSSETTREQFAT